MEGEAQLTVMLPYIHIHIHTHTTPTPQCPLLLRRDLRPCPQAQICGPINILYVCTCSVVAFAESYFKFTTLSLHGEMLKLNFIRSLSRDKATLFPVWTKRPEWKMRGRMRHCRFICTNASNVWVFRMVDKYELHDC